MATENFTGTTGNKVNTLANWDGAGAGATGGLVINSNEAEADLAEFNGGTAGNWYTGASFNANQSAQAVVTAIASGVYVGVGVRMSGTDGGANLTGYLFYSDSAKSYIDEYSAGSYIGTLAGPGAAFSVNDTVYLEINGTNLTAKINGSTELTVSDASIASGAPGICAFGDGASRIDDWVGNDLTAGSPSSSVSPSVSPSASISPSSSVSPSVSPSASLSPSSSISPSVSPSASVSPSSSLSPSPSSSISPSASVSPSSSVSPSISPSASVSPSSSVSPSISPSASVSPSSSLSPSASQSPSASPSPTAAPLEGDVCWGHVTGVTETNVVTFFGHWFGTGTVENSGDSERVALDVGQYMESELVDTGAYTVTLLQNTYSAGDNVSVSYRTGANESATYAANWETYTGPFTSAGFVQVRLDYPMLLEVSGTNARYTVDQTGKAVYLAGFHTWYNIQDGGGSDPPDAFDWDEYLQAILDYGCNFTKLWASLETTVYWADPFTSGFNPQYFAQNRYTRTGPGNAADGGLKFDLDQISTTYLDRVYDRVKELADNGIYCVIQLFQGWQIEDKGGSDQPFDYHPFNTDNNINSIDGDQNADGDGTETHRSGASNVVLTYQEDFVETLVNLLNNFENIIWEISNEDTGHADNTTWQEYIIDHIGTLEASLPKQHLILRTVCYPSGSNSDLDASDAEVVSYSHRNTVDGTKVSMSDTDHVEGITSDYEWAWIALCNGHDGSWYMDEWDGALYGTDRRSNATYQLIRANVGYALAQFELLQNPLLMTPQPSLCSTGYCLARDHATAAEYVCFQDGTGSFTLDLSTATGTLNIRWLRCSTGETDTDTVSGGSASQSLTPPWSGVVVAYVYH